MRCVFSHESQLVAQHGHGGRACVRTFARSSIILWHLLFLCLPTEDFKATVEEPASRCLECAESPYNILDGSKKIAH